MKPVLTKADFVRRYCEGEFGNRALTWDTLDEWFNEMPWISLGEESLYHVRNRVAGAETWYNIDFGRVPITWNRAADKYRPENLYISAMAPHEHNLVQGEVQQAPGGLQLYYSTVPFVPMREALAKSARQVVGLRAKIILDRCMNDLSRQWLDYLLEAYEDHVIEFSSFSVCWGTVPGHNTVFWEIRKY